MKIKKRKTNLRIACMLLAAILALCTPAGLLTQAQAQSMNEMYVICTETQAPESDGADVPSNTDVARPPSAGIESEIPETETELDIVEEADLAYDEEEIKEVTQMGYIGIQPFSINHGAAFITGSQLLDANGDPQTVFGYYEPFRAHFTFSIPDAVPVNTGDSMTVAIPSPLLLVGFPTAHLIDADGNVIGEFTVNPAAGIATVTFTTDLPSGARGRQGSFWFGIVWDRNIVDEGDEIYIQLPGSSTGGNYTVGDAIQISPDERLWKYGWFSDCGDYIAWMIRVNVAGDDIPNAVLRDTLPDGLELVEHYWGIYDVFIEVGQMNGATFIRQNSYFPDEHGRLTVGADDFTVNLGNLVRGSSTAMPDGSLPNAVTLRVIYNTRITEPQDSFTNLARLTGDGMDESITATIRPESGIEIRWYDIDFRAYKEVYGAIGPLASPETFLFEIIDTQANQAIAWGRAVVNQSGVPVEIDFYSDAGRTVRMLDTWPVLENGRTYRLEEVGAHGWYVTYSGGSGSLGNTFLVSASLTNAEDVLVIRFTVLNTASGSGGNGGNGGNGGGNGGSGGSNGGGNGSNGGGTPPGGGRYIEIDDAGTPTGEWVWDDGEEVWTLIENTPVPLAASGAPQTGLSGIGLYVFMMAVSMIGMAVLFLNRKRKEKALDGNF